MDEVRRVETKRNGTNPIEFVGGPLDGRETDIWGPNGYAIPDSKDMIHVLLANGETATLFGFHNYAAATCGREMGGHREYIDQWKYAGYTPPVVPDGAMVIDLSGKEMN